MDALAKLKKLTTYSRKNHGINAHLQPRKYYLAYEDVELLIKELEQSDKEWRESHDALLERRNELLDRIKSLEAENEELRKKNVHLDKEALHFRDLYEQGLTIIKELNQPLPSKPEN